MKVYELKGDELLFCRSDWEYDMKRYGYTWEQLLMADVDDVSHILYPEPDFGDEWLDRWEDPLDKKATDITPYDVYSTSELL